MNITTVSIRRLRNLGNFENVSVELTATVGDDELAEQVYASLREMVDDLLFPELRQRQPAVSTAEGNVLWTQDDSPL